MGALAAQPGMKQQAYLAFHATQDPITADDVALPLEADNGQYASGVMAPLSFQLRTRGDTVQAEVDPDGKVGALRAGDGGSSRGRMVAAQQVRRLTPTECARLQGFPDDWLTGSDTAKYRALGNAVTVNVAEWLGRRIVEWERR